MKYIFKIFILVSLIIGFMGFGYYPQKKLTNEVDSLRSQLQEMAGKIKNLQRELGNTGRLVFDTQKKIKGLEEKLAALNNKTKEELNRVKIKTDKLDDNPQKIAECTLDMFFTQKILEAKTNSPRVTVNSDAEQKIKSLEKKQKEMQHNLDMIKLNQRLRDDYNRLYNGDKLAPPFQEMYFPFIP